MAHHPDPRPGPAADASLAGLSRLSGVPVPALEKLLARGLIRVRSRAPGMRRTFNPDWAAGVRRAAAEEGLIPGDE
ncbi:MAG: hypothetical protein C0501_17525 [Isosphaera sp.]|nr:hypothetical protein [Isosphaera sp.]